MNSWGFQMDFEFDNFGRWLVPVTARMPGPEVRALVSWPRAGLGNGL